MRALIRSSCVTALLALFSIAAIGAEETLRITPFINGNHVVVSFELNDAYTDAVREGIASGLKTTFTYELELRARAWIDRTIATTVVATTDQYENLTRRHTLTKTVDGRVEDVMVTEDDEVVKAWRTKGNGGPVGDTTPHDRAREQPVRGPEGSH